LVNARNSNLSNELIDEVKHIKLLISTELSSDTANLCMMKLKKVMKTAEKIFSN
jgi:hypothetical protein